VPCDTHGDLHLSHVYLFPDRAPPDDLVIIDCIEFAERFRFADPVADLAFLVMDLQFHGRRDLAAACAEAYFAADRLTPSPPEAGGEGGGEGVEARGAGNQPPGPSSPSPLTPDPSPPASGGEGDRSADARRLLPFYVAYRAVVRAKVEGMQAEEPEVPDAQRGMRRFSAEAHWRLALSTLEEPLRRPALVLVGGLPGTGKSTLSRALAQAANFTVIRSDEVRKELAGVPVTEKGEGVYTPEWTSRTYVECGRRAEAIIRDGSRVIVDASFAPRRFRVAFLVRATQLAVPGLLLVCRTDPELVRERLRARHGDVSDADERVYDELAEKWEPAIPRYERPTVEIDTTDAGRALDQALGVLRGMGLA
jgi:predicted kinase